MKIKNKHKGKVSIKFDNIAEEALVQEFLLLFKTLTYAELRNKIRI